MKLRQKVYQMFILGFDEKNTPKALMEGLSGVIFFTKDITSLSVFKDLIKNLREKSIISPFLSIDQEGGRVERTLNLHGGQKYLSAKRAFEKGFKFLEQQTQEISDELKDLGVNLNFAPCVDVNSNPNNPIIGERSFSSSPEDVIKAGSLVSKIYQKNGIIPCIKHFPGHGDTSVDSHLELPYISMSLEEMERVHIKPFREIIKNGIEMVMVAHLNTKCFEHEGIPTSLSKNAIEYLRNSLKFSGVVISDDMFMKALSKYGFEAACEMGIMAGINLFIYKDASDEIIEMIENIVKKAENNFELRQKIEMSYEKICNLKFDYFLTL